jgi:hypothetical protein
MPTLAKFGTWHGETGSCRLVKNPKKQERKQGEGGNALGEGNFKPNAVELEGGHSDVF